MLNALLSSRRQLISCSSRVLFVLVVAVQLQACEDGRADTGDQQAPLTEQQRLARALYGNSDAKLYWWPNLRNAPPATRQSAEQANHILAALPQAEVSAFSIDYGSNDLPQIALWIRRPGNQELLIYNHGHVGLPEPSEDFAIRFLRLAIESGNDILLTSMPLTGLNAPIPGMDYHIRTADSPELTRVDTELLTTFAFPHSLYEIIDDPDLYLHYFIDAAIVPAAFLSPATARAPSAFLARPATVLPSPPSYLDVTYVGLSGGATTGLAACAVLSLRRCVLVAGVMPNDLRAKYWRNFGDAEQQSRSVYQHFSVNRLLSIAASSTDKLVMLFNERDPCCFADPSASEFRRRYPDYDIRVLPLDFHGYEPQTLLDILRN
jgi:hypothetical protein